MVLYVAMILKILPTLHWCQMFKRMKFIAKLLELFDCIESCIGCVMLLKEQFICCG